MTSYDLLFVPVFYTMYRLYLHSFEQSQDVDEKSHIFYTPPLTIQQDNRKLE